jgi:hypothetical protein
MESVCQLQFKLGMSLNMFVTWSTYINWKIFIEIILVTVLLRKVILSTYLYLLGYVQTMLAWACNVTDSYDVMHVIMRVFGHLWFYFCK